MLTELCKELKNWFETDIVFGVFTVENGSIDLSDFIQDGQYFRIVGSVFNDGVYQYPVSGLVDESFDGAVWPMAVPPTVITLASEIGEWVGKYSQAVNGPYSSESVPNYSYTLKTNSNSGGGSGSPTWQSTFADKLNKWRKAR